MAEQSVWQINAKGKLELHLNFHSLTPKDHYKVLEQKRNELLLPLIIENLRNLKCKGIIWLIRPVDMPLLIDEKDALSLLGLKLKFHPLFNEKWVTYVFEWQCFSN